MSLQRTQQETTATEFLEWAYFLNAEEIKHKKFDYYFARTIAEIRRSWIKEPKKVKDEDFLINYKEKNAKPMTIKQKTSIAKLFWSMIFAAKRKRK